MSISDDGSSLVQTKVMLAAPGHSCNIPEGSKFASNIRLCYKHILIIYHSHAYTHTNLLPSQGIDEGKKRKRWKKSEFKTIGEKFPIIEVYGFAGLISGTTFAVESTLVYANYNGWD